MIAQGLSRLAVLAGGQAGALTPLAVASAGRVPGDGGRSDCGGNAAPVRQRRLPMMVPEEFWRRSEGPPAGKPAGNGRRRWAARPPDRLRSVSPAARSRDL
ncbi:hypothetical protein N177_2819 [Lutibaculum baratangense AMV1]|uniref:Uncharacterized protein n=1 Tax=Lutibaculum baratangense AMV1 TaxID=631454 RepID=V4REU6_9HYPH|nr:hypothetical protein N177_2819 [Lutibaculum baratangense AMV1]